MNFRPALLVRVVCLLLAPGWTVPCVAQGGDGSLTGDFKKLSPKERSKIAARETHEAAADSGYQDIMKQADAAFRAGRYEDALAAFHEARSIRPYNVYPKVKIQDLQALIKKQDEERVGQTPVVPPPADPPGPAVVATPSLISNTMTGRPGCCAKLSASRIAWKRSVSPSDRIAAM